MPVNKHALIRYKTIDKCLQNKYTQWTLEALIEACSEALTEYEGKESSVSKRTTQLDIQLMRSNKLGYNAPIESYDKKYYRYSDSEYTIANIPITDSDMHVLTETIEVLKQFKDFSLFNDVKDIFQKLEDKVYSEQNNFQPVIYFDKNDDLKGTHHLDTLYHSIINHIVLEIEYQSFKARESQTFIFHPLILKQFNNRWFLVGARDSNSKIENLALDRIIKISSKLNLEPRKIDFDAKKYYENVYGVTVSEFMRPNNIHLKINSYHKPYILTKPIHHSQEIIEELTNGSIIINLKLQVNFEIERLILGFGDGVEVIQPLFLRKRMIQMANRMKKIYDEVK